MITGDFNESGGHFITQQQDGPRNQRVGDGMLRGAPYQRRKHALQPNAQDNFTLVEVLDLVSFPKWKKDRFNPFQIG